MSTYLKLFNEDAEYQQFKETEEDILPNVSFVESDNVVYYNPLNTFLSQFQFSIDVVSLLSEASDWWKLDDDLEVSKCTTLYEHFRNGTYNNKSLANSTIYFFEVNEETGVINENPYILFNDGERIEFSKEEPLYKWATQDVSEEHLGRMYIIQIGEHLNSYAEEDFAGVITTYDDYIYYDETEGTLNTSNYGDPYNCTYLETFFSTTLGYYANYD